MKACSERSVAPVETGRCGAAPPIILRRQTMRHILIATALVGSVLASSAMAADLTDKGAIKAMDAKKCTITLADAKGGRCAGGGGGAGRGAGGGGASTDTV